MKRGGLGLERLANLFSVTVMAPVAMQPGSRQPSSLLFHRGFKPGVFLHNSERKKGLPRILPNWRGPQAHAPKTGISALYLNTSILSQKLHQPLGKQVPQSSLPAAWVWVKEHRRSHSWNGQDSGHAPAAEWSCSCGYHRARLGLETGE